MASSSSDSILLPVGTVLADTYETKGVLGKPGGFGITYLARDLRLDDLVAVKEFFPMSLARRTENGKSLVPATPDHADSFAAGRQRFVDEARMLARFRHPNIVRVRTLFEENGTGYLVMDYLEGRTLASHLARVGGRVSAETALAIARPLIAALRALHAQGVLHRDLDPHNIYITNEHEVVLLDFGAARQAQVAGDTRSLSVILKPGYAPYEQYASRGRQGPWTDLYALAATIYRMLAGHPPPEALGRLNDDDLVPVETVVREKYDQIVPPSLAAALAWGLQVRPTDRPQNVDAFASLLFADTNPEQVRRPASPDRLPVAASIDESSEGNRKPYSAPPERNRPASIPLPSPRQGRSLEPRSVPVENAPSENQRGFSPIAIVLTLVVIPAVMIGLSVFENRSLPFIEPVSQENMKGVVWAFDQTAKTATIDGTDYTVSEGVVWPMDLATGDSVEFAAAGTVISALDKIRIPGNSSMDRHPGS